MTPDMYNAGFELAGGVLKMLDIVALYKAKQVRGVSMIPVYFFVSWAIFNIYFYSAINQTYSFYAGLVLLLTNAVWVAMALYYTYFKCDETCKSSVEFTIDV